jgi:hypothetical protein
LKKKRKYTQSIFNAENCELKYLSTQGSGIEDEDIKKDFEEQTEYSKTLLISEVRLNKFNSKKIFD